MITGEDAKKLVCKLRELINDVNGFQGQIDEINQILDELEINSQQLTGTFSSNGLTTSFALPHTLGVIPTYVQITNQSADAQDWSSYTKTSSQIIIMFDVAPPIGTNNIVFSVTVTK